MLGRYMPEVDPEPPRTKAQRTAVSKTSALLRSQVCLTASVAAFNVAVLVWAAVTHPLDGRGVGTLYTGNCETVGAADSATHLVLNALSSLFLGSSNYCMQVLAAPSRSDLDSAHAAGSWLEVGVPSFGNLWKLRRRRAVLWLLLGLVSVLLHTV